MLSHLLNFFDYLLFLGVMSENKESFELMKEQMG